MNAFPATLPTGALGRGLALGGTLLLLALLWFAAAGPLIGWYQDRAAAVAQRRVYADHMALLADQLPDLRARAAALHKGGPTVNNLLEGTSDSIAGARLQEIVQTLAAHEGVTLTSTETLPAVPTGTYRRIALRISLAAPYAVIVRLLQAIAEASPRMLVDDLELQGSVLVNKPVDAPVDAHITVLAFRPSAVTSPNAATSPAAGATGNTP